MKKVFLKILKFTGKHLCRGLFCNNVAGHKKETPAQVFSCEFCETFKNNIFTEHVRTTATVYAILLIYTCCCSSVVRKYSDNWIVGIL